MYIKLIFYIFLFFLIFINSSPVKNCKCPTIKKFSVPTNNPKKPTKNYRQKHHRRFKRGETCICEGEGVATDNEGFTHRPGKELMREGMEQEVEQVEGKDRKRRRILYICDNLSFPNLEFNVNFF
ncbi:unnamed protein product [Meloidogyne enterolobii]|uniref:Uncharacterized protein n=1 Tax=Meloidogyne enterolobii TaxID=390850 RepID=A0ACB0Z0S7_MELEN